MSHGLLDHIHDAVPMAQVFSPEVVAIFETCHWLESKGVKNTRPMNKGGSQKVGDVTVTMTHAIHSCGILDDGKIIYGGEAGGGGVRLAAGRGLYFAGGTEGFGGNDIIGGGEQPSVVFFAVGGPVSMRPPGD